MAEIIDATADGKTLVYTDAVGGQVGFVKIGCSGFEGVAVEPRPGGGYVLRVAQQRGWGYTTPGCEAFDDDPTGANAGEPGFTRVGAYDPSTGASSHVPYELEAKPGNAAWVGLSEITGLPDGTFGLIERDNLSGDFSEIKQLTQVPLTGPVTRAAKREADLLAPLRATHGWISDKPEGFTVAADGRSCVITDNDGVDDATGETRLLRLTWRRLSADTDRRPDPPPPVSRDGRGDGSRRPGRGTDRRGACASPRRPRP